MFPDIINIFTTFHQERMMTIKWIILIPQTRIQECLKHIKVISGSAVALEPKQKHLLKHSFYNIENYDEV
jgi:hypothetical protein